MIETSAWRKFVQSFATAYPRPRLLVLALIVVSSLVPVAWFGGYSSFPPARPESLYPLLAALPATLGTLFVLAFTFTLVTAQIASNYNHILFHRILGPWVLWYLIPFTIGILLPLFLLNGHFHLWAVQVSLLIGTFCVVSLLPFAVAVKELLSVPEAIEDKARQLSHAGSETDAHDLVREIGNISVGALTLRDFATFECGVENLVRCAEGKAFTDLRLPIAKELRRMTFRNSQDPFAAEILMDSIMRVGFGNGDDTEFSAPTEVLDEIESAYRSVNIAALWGPNKAIERIGNLAQFQPSVAGKCLVILHIIGERAISEIPVEVGAARSAILALGNLLQHRLSTSDVEPGDEQILLSSLARLEDLGIRANLHDKTTLSDLALQQIHEATRACSSERAHLKRHLEAVMVRLERPTQAQSGADADPKDALGHED